MLASARYHASKTGKSTFSDLPGTSFSTNARKTAYLQNIGANPNMDSYSIFQDTKNRYVAVDSSNKLAVYHSFAPYTTPTGDWWDVGAVSDSIGATTRARFTRLQFDKVALVVTTDTIASYDRFHKFSGTKPTACNKTGAIKGTITITDQGFASIKYCTAV